MANSVTERHRHPQFPRLRIELRSSSRYYQAVTQIDGRLRQSSLKVTQLETALRLAEDWYRRELRASVEFGQQHPYARLTADPTMAELFASYRQSMPTEQRRVYVKAKWSPIAPFWRSRTVSTVKTQTFKEFFVWRRSRNRRVSTVKNHTLHNDTVLIRQLMKYAVEDGMLEQLPVIPRIGKIEVNPRPWFEPHEWRQLLRVSEQRIAAIKFNPRLKRQREDLHDLMLFLYWTCCRVGEVVQGLRFEDGRIEQNKKGTRCYCWK
jgi:integrase